MQQHVEDQRSVQLASSWSPFAESGETIRAGDGSGGGRMEGENGKAVRLIRRFLAGLGDGRGLWQRDNIFIFWVLLWSPVAGQQGAWEWERTA